MADRISFKCLTGKYLTDIAVASLLRTFWVGRFAPHPKCPRPNRQGGYYSIVMLIVGLVGATAANPVMAYSSAQDSSEKPLPLQMAQSASLAGSWRLVSMTESSAPTPMVVPQDTVLTAEFSDGRISGSGGCNRFMGGYQSQGGQLSIGPLASTFMACEQPAMGQEAKYLAALQGAQRYAIDSQGQLTISYQTEQQSGVLRFTSQTVRALW